MLSILSKSFEQPKDESVGKIENVFYIDTSGDQFDPEAVGVPETETSFKEYGNEDEEEDCWIIVKSPAVKKNQNKKRKSSTQVSHKTDLNIFTNFKKYWRKFFLNYNVKLNSSQGRKILLRRLKKYKSNEEKSKKIRIRLTKLIRQLKKLKTEESSDVTDIACKFKKFESFIRKQVKLLKSNPKNSK